MGTMTADERRLLELLAATNAGCTGDFLGLNNS
jgi:hypothetical protein